MGDNINNGGRLAFTHSGPESSSRRVPYEMLTSHFVPSQQQFAHMQQATLGEEFLRRSYGSLMEAVVRARL
jgi:hypothetical protein